MKMGCCACMRWCNIARCGGQHKKGKHEQPAQTRHWPNISLCLWEASSAWKGGARTPQQIWRAGDYPSIYEVSHWFFLQNGWTMELNIVS